MRSLLFSAIAILSILACSRQEGSDAPASALKLSFGDKRPKPNSIQYLKELADDSTLCSVTFIDETRALTAAHCLYNQDGTPRKHLTVAVTNKSSPTQERRLSVIGQCAHPEFGAKMGELGAGKKFPHLTPLALAPFDIALIHMDKSIEKLDVMSDGSMLYENFLIENTDLDPFLGLYTPGRLLENIWITGLATADVDAQFKEYRIGRAPAARVFFDLGLSVSEVSNGAEGLKVTTLPSLLDGDSGAPMMTLVSPKLMKQMLGMSTEEREKEVTVPVKLATAINSSYARAHFYRTPGSGLLGQLSFSWARFASVFAHPMSIFNKVLLHQVAGAGVDLKTMSGYQRDPVSGRLACGIQPNDPSLQRIHEHLNHMSGQELYRVQARSGAGTIGASLTATNVDYMATYLSLLSSGMNQVEATEIAKRDGKEVPVSFLDDDLIQFAEMIKYRGKHFHWSESNGDIESKRLGEKTVMDAITQQNIDATIPLIFTHASEGSIGQKYCNAVAINLGQSFQGHSHWLALVRHCLGEEDNYEKLKPQITKLCQGELYNKGIEAQYNKQQVACLKGPDGSAFDEQKTFFLPLSSNEQSGYSYDLALIAIEVGGSAMQVNSHALPVLSFDAFQSQLKSIYFGAFDEDQKYNFAEPGQGYESDTFIFGDGSFGQNPPASAPVFIHNFKTGASNSSSVLTTNVNNVSHVVCMHSAPHPLSSKGNTCVNLMKLAENQSKLVSLNSISPNPAPVPATTSSGGGSGGGSGTVPVIAPGNSAAPSVTEVVIEDASGDWATDNAQCEARPIEQRCDNKSGCFCCNNAQGLKCNLRQGAGTHNSFVDGQRTLTNASTPFAILDKAKLSCTDPNSCYVCWYKIMVNNKTGWVYEPGDDCSE